MFSHLQYGVGGRRYLCIQTFYLLAYWIALSASVVALAVVVFTACLMLWLLFRLLLLYYILDPFTMFLRAHPLSVVLRSLWLESICLASATRESLNLLFPFTEWIFPSSHFGFTFNRWFKVKPKCLMILTKMSKSSLGRFIPLLLKRFVL